MLNPRQVISALKQNIGKVIVGKDEVIELLLIALMCKGHVLLEDVPGTGKTTMVSALAKSLDCSFNRIQFTPDVVPSDVTGFTMVNFKTGEMEYHPGAIMCQIALADEINRAPAKVQSALLEAMQEKQVTIAGECYKLPKPFLVMATQNPIEQEGTYPLPEAQLDRFMFKIEVGYPSRSEEGAVVERMARPSPVISRMRRACWALSAAFFSSNCRRSSGESACWVYLRTVCRARMASISVMAIASL